MHQPLTTCRPEVIIHYLLMANTCLANLWHYSYQCELLPLERKPRNEASLKTDFFLVLFPHTASYQCFQSEIMNNNRLRLLLIERLLYFVTQFILTSVHSSVLLHENSSWGLLLYYKDKTFYFPSSIHNHICIGLFTYCTGRISANTRPHQLHWDR